MKIILILLIILFIILIIFLRLYEIDIKTLNFKNIILHNEIATYNNTVHNKLFSLLDNININNINNINNIDTNNINNTNNTNNISILEIGAGNGLSTERFIKYLNNNNIKFIYDICECDIKYKSTLNNKFKNNKIYFSTWDKIVSNKKKYDIIFMTVFSSININNIHKFKKLFYKNTILLTLSHYNINKKFGFKILKQKKHGLLNLYMLKIN